MIVAANGGDLPVMTSSGALPAGSAGKPYSFTFTAAGGMVPYRFGSSAPPSG